KRGDFVKKKEWEGKLKKRFADIWHTAFLSFQEIEKAFQKNPQSKEVKEVISKIYFILLKTLEWPLEADTFRHYFQKMVAFYDEKGVFEKGLKDLEKKEELFKLQQVKQKKAPAQAAAESTAESKRETLKEKKKIEKEKPLTGARAGTKKEQAKVKGREKAEQVVKREEGRKIVEEKLSLQSKISKDTVIRKAKEKAYMKRRRFSLRAKAGILLGIVVLFFILRYFSAPSQKENVSSKVASKAASKSIAKTEVSLKTLPYFSSSSGKSISFPALPTGTYKGRFLNFFPQEDVNFLLISLNNGEDIRVILGIEGVEPSKASVQQRENISYLRFATAGFVVNMIAVQKEGEKILGRFSNLVTEDKGSWYLSP
ncbi:MAG: hypothetical protein D6780_08680, partial [Candidatus Dadabacteria bacterium]